MLSTWFIWSIIFFGRKCLYFDWNYLVSSTDHPFQIPCRCHRNFVCLFIDCHGQSLSERTNKPFRQQNYLCCLLWMSENQTSNFHLLIDQFALVLEYPVSDVVHLPWHNTKFLQQLPIKKYRVHYKHNWKQRNSLARNFTSK